MNDDILNKFRDKLDTAIDHVKRAREEDDRRRLMSTIGQDLAGMMAPFLAEIATSSKMSKETIAELMYQLRGEVADASIKGIDTTPIITAIEQAMGNVNIPQPKVTVNVPPIRIPDIKMPDEMSIKGWAEMMGAMHDTDNPIPVQLRDHNGNPINIFEHLTAQVGGGGGKSDLFTIKGFSQSAYAELMNADGRLKVSVESGSTGLTDAELRASSVPVEQVSGSIWSTYVTGFGASVAASMVDSSGTQYSGSNPVPVTLISGGLTSTISVGSTVSDAVDDGSAPVKVGGIARTANPTAVHNGDTVSASYDKVGRQLTRSQARDLTVTAYATLTNGTETTLVSAVAGSYLDLVYIMGANNSDAAVTVDIRPVTAGNIVMTLQVPANGVAGIACPMPLPQGDTGNNWTADMGDITGTSLYLTALFSKEI